MLTTTLKLSTVRNNGGTTSVVANLIDGREVWIGNSTAIGGKRAIYEVLSGAGTGSTIAETAKLLKRFERIEREIIERNSGDDCLIRAAAELGIDLTN